MALPSWGIVPEIAKSHPDQKEWGFTHGRKRFPRLHESRYLPAVRITPYILVRQNGQWESLSPWGLGTPQAKQGYALSFCSNFL